MKIFFASEPEIEELTDLRMFYFETECYKLDENQFEEIRKQNIDYLKDHLNGSGYVAAASENGRIIAAAYLTIIHKAANLHFPTGCYGEVYGVYTLPEFRRQGISTKLMNLVMDKCREENCSFVQLGATQEGFPVYKKLGFYEQEEEYKPMEFRFV